MPAKVNEELCEGCEDCVETCSTQAITMADGKAKIDEEACVECVACVDACQQHAITIPA